MTHLAHFKKLMAGVGIVGALTAMSIAPTLADTSGVAQEITAGTLDMTIPANVAFASATTAYSHTAHTVSSNTFQIAIDDSSGSGDGWNVNMSVSALTANLGADTIAATNIDLGSIGQTTVVNGQAATNITEPTAANTDLSSARVVSNAPVGEGQGSYTLDTTIDINIPAYQKAGAYTGTLTVNVVSGPTAP